MKKLFTLLILLCAVVTANADPLSNCYIYVKADAAPNLYVWKTGNVAINGSWPGNKMSATETLNGVTYFKAGPFANDAENWVGVILSNGNGSQTSDYFVTESNFFAYNGSTGISSIPSVRGLNGSWNPGIPMNTEDGTNYTLSTTLTGNQSFKVFQKTGAGGNETGWYPGNNYDLTILGTNVPVQFSFNASTNEVSATKLWVDDVWTLAGCLYDGEEKPAPGFVESNFDPTDTNNNLAETPSGSGIWTITYDGTVPAGTYRLKVVNNHAWDFSYPSEDNYVLKVWKNNSTVTVNFNESSTAIKTFVANEWSVVGSSAALNGDTDWDLTTEDNNMTITSGTTWQLVVSNKFLYKGKTYSFRVVNNHAYDFVYPSGNEDWNVNVSGYYNITYSFDTSTNTVSVNASRITTGYEKYIYVLKDKDANNASAPNIHVWDYNGSTSTVLNGEWPGGLMSDTETINGVEFWKAGPFVSSFSASDGIGFKITQNKENGTTDQWTGSLSEYVVYDSSLEEANRLKYIPCLLGGPTDWNIGLPIVNTSGQFTSYFTLSDNSEFKFRIGGTQYTSNNSSAVEVITDSNKENLALSTGKYNFKIVRRGIYPLTVNTATPSLTVGVSSNVVDLQYFQTSGEKASYAYNGSAYNYTTTDTSWHGIVCSLPNATTSADYLLIKRTDTTNKMYVYVKATDDTEINHTTFPAGTLNCYLPLGSAKNIKEIQIKNPAAGTITLTECSLKSAAEVANTTVASVQLQTDARGYATFSSVCPVAIPDGITAKYPSKVSNNGTITWATFKNGIPANQGALLEGTAGQPYNFKITGTVDDITPAADITMQPIAETKWLAQSEDENVTTNYILSKVDDKVGFYKVNQYGSWVKAGTAYLKVLTSAISGAPAFFPLDGGTTAIDNLTTDTEAEKFEGKAIYNTAGQRVDKNYRGIVIVNGKKYFNK